MEKPKSYWIGACIECKLPIMITREKMYSGSMVNDGQIYLLSSAKGKVFGGCPKCQGDCMAWIRIPEKTELKYRLAFGVNKYVMDGSGKKVWQTISR